MKTRFFTTIIILLFCAFAVQTAQAQQTPERSIGEFLDEDGRFHNPDGYSGSLDVSGFDFYRDKTGAPVFSPTGNGNPDNEYWTLESKVPGVNNTVRVLAVSGDDLYVGGDFTRAGGDPANRIARYDMVNSSWHALGGGVSGTVRALAVSGGDLYVGGAVYQRRWAGGQPYCPL